MAPKRKPGKRRSKDNGLIRGILIGLAVIGVLGGVGFVGYLVYSKAILPALAEQKLREAEEAKKPVVLPSGWRFYSRGQFQMLVPDKPQSDLPAPQQNPDGGGETPLYLASADGIEVYISLFSVRPTPGRKNFYDYYKFKGVPSILEFTSERQLEGSPRGQEAYSINNGKTAFTRVYEDSPASILIIDIQGDTQSEAFKNVVRSMSFQASAPSTTQQPTSNPATLPPIASPPVDLLNLINPQMHRIAGDWKKYDHYLRSPVMEATMLELPFQATSSYELIIKVERVEKKADAFFVAFPIADSWGMVVVDGNFGAASGLNLHNGQKVDSNPDRYRGRVFSSSENQIRLRVTPNTIHVEVEGLRIVN